MDNDNDNYFFRKCMPYVVMVENGFLVVKNRYYEEIFKCFVPTDFNTKAFFSSFDVWGSTWPNEGYLYNDRSSPIGNESGYDRDYMNQYFERLRKLIKKMKGCLHVDQYPEISGTNDRFNEPLDA